MTIENGVVQNKKVALVTGGSRGLGKDIALSLARMGVGIVLTYHSNKTEGERVAEEIQASGGKAIALSLDVSITASFDTFFDSLRVVLPEKFGTEKIDFLINNAGFGKAIPIEKLTEPDFDRFVDVHFKGVVFLTQKALAIMNDGGVSFSSQLRPIAITCPVTPPTPPARERSKSSRDMWRKNMVHEVSGQTPSHQAAS